MALTFVIHDDDVVKLEKWNKEGHTKTCRYINPMIKPRSAIGGEVTYRFTPATLGTVIVVQCACGAKIDLTDYENW